MNPQQMASKIVQATIARAQRELPEFPMQVSPTAQLFGGTFALLDSLNLVTFVFILEDEFKRISDLSLKVTTQDVVVTHSPPFKSLHSLTAFVSQKLQHGD